MVKKPKTYKIYPFYDKLLYSFLSIYERDSLTEELIKRYFHFDDISKAGKYNLNQFIEHILNDIFNYKEPINELSFYLSDPRVKHIKELFNNNHHDKQRVELSVRISETTIQKVSSFSEHTETIGEVIELALAYHLSICDKRIYSIIEFYFKQNL